MPSIVPLPKPIPVDFYVTTPPDDTPEGVQEALTALALSLGVSMDPTVDLSDVVLGQLNGLLPLSDVGPWFNNNEWWFPSSKKGFYSRSEESIPIGMIMMWGGTGTPANGNWLLCDGSEVLRSQYSVLFQNIGTTWGAGDGSTTFNLPPGAKMFLNAPGFVANSIVPLDPGFPAPSGVGARGGSQVSPYLLPSNLPAMYLRIPYFNFNAAQPGVYGITALTPPGSGTGQSSFPLADVNGAPINNLEQTLFSIMPPFAACNYIIKWQ